MNLTEAYNHIFRGDWDDQLEEIKRLVDERQRVRGIIEAAGTAIGDRVRVNESVRPLAFVGLEGSVVRKDKRFVVVKLQIPNVYTRSKLRRYLGPDDEVKLRPGTFELV